MITFQREREAERDLERGRARTARRARRGRRAREPLHRLRGRRAGVLGRRRPEGGAGREPRRDRRLLPRHGRRLRAHRVAAAADLQRHLRLVPRRRLRAGTRHRLPHRRRDRRLRPPRGRARDRAQLGRDLPAGQSARPGAREGAHAPEAADRRRRGLPPRRGDRGRPGGPGPYARPRARHAGRCAPAARRLGRQAGRRRHRRVEPGSGRPDRTARLRRAGPDGRSQGSRPGLRRAEERAARAARPGRRP